MKKNLGSVDRSIRILIALAIVVLAFTKIVTGILAIVLLVVAAVFLLTSLLGVCPLYMLLGLSTSKKKV
jgi:hypothetical protein